MNSTRREVTAARLSPDGRVLAVAAEGRAQSRAVRFSFNFDKAANIVCRADRIRRIHEAGIHFPARDVAGRSASELQLAATSPIDGTYDPHRRACGSAPWEASAASCDDLFPYRAVRARPRRNVRLHALRRRLQLRPWTWSLDPEDWMPTATTTGIVSTAREMRGGDVMLLHDGVAGPEAPEALDRSATLEAVPAIIRLAREMGLMLVTLDDPFSRPPAGHTKL